MYSSNARQTAHNYDVILNGAGSETESKLMFNTMSELRKKNKESGYHFFDRETMKFWDSKLESTLYKGCFFITSEKRDLLTRRATSPFGRPSPMVTSSLTSSATAPSNRLVMPFEESRCDE